MTALAFADPVFESQATFRSVLRAMASPGQIVDVGDSLAPPPLLGRAAAAALLTLADFETPLWIAPSFAGSGVGAYLEFHTGAPLAASPENAAFALADAAADAVEFIRFSQGTAEYPDRSTTLILQVRRLSPGAGLRLVGPGVRGASELNIAPLPADFLAQWQANHASFPLGIDLILAAGSRLAALPRSVGVTGDA
ncbi:MAG TPA: phosphonate C-P lyase system protein PhnH [Bradyrhizobium sp.]|nr:phosphonate C-P lyase system protein PhnH [Bradyrhizobium sp.]